MNHPQRIHKRQTKKKEAQHLRRAIGIPGHGTVPFLVRIRRLQVLAVALFTPCLVLRTFEQVVLLAMERRSAALPVATVDASHRLAEGVGIDVFELRVRVVISWTRHIGRLRFRQASITTIERPDNETLVGTEDADKPLEGAMVAGGLPRGNRHHFDLTRTSTDLTSSFEMSVTMDLKRRDYARARIRGKERRIRPGRGGARKLLTIWLAVPAFPY